MVIKRTVPYYTVIQKLISNLSPLRIPEERRKLFPYQICTFLRVPAPLSMLYRVLGIMVQYQPYYFLRRTNI
jgi:hypothetical protein